MRRKIIKHSYRTRGTIGTKLLLYEPKLQFEWTPAQNRGIDSGGI
jgi:hypothetical protein